MRIHYWTCEGILKYKMFLDGNNSTKWNIFLVIIGIFRGFGQTSYRIIQGIVYTHCHTQIQYLWRFNEYGVWCNAARSLRVGNWYSVISIESLRQIQHLLRFNEYGMWYSIALSPRVVSWYWVIIIESLEQIQHLLRFNEYGMWYSISRSPRVVSWYWVISIESLGQIQHLLRCNEYGMWYSIARSPRVETLCESKITL